MKKGLFENSSIKLVFGKNVIFFALVQIPFHTMLNRNILGKLEKEYFSALKKIVLFQLCFKYML